MQTNIDVKLQLLFSWLCKPLQVYEQFNKTKHFYHCFILRIEFYVLFKNHITILLPFHDTEFTEINDLCYPKFYRK